MLPFLYVPIFVSLILLKPMSSAFVFQKSIRTSAIRFIGPTSSLQQGLLRHRLSPLSSYYITTSHQSSQRMSQLALHSTSTSTNISTSDNENDNNESLNKEVPVPAEQIPIHLAEGLFCAYKPLTWTSQDVVGYIRGMLERDARNRGAQMAKRRSKSKRKIKVGHGGTLDPLAEGILVIGVGSGTKALEGYLKGSKGYTASVELGYETNTLDREGNVTQTADVDHVTEESVLEALPKFTGDIMQVPPIFSAIKKGGKRMYEEARSGKTEADVQLDPRPVTIYNIDYLPTDHEGKSLPCFGLNVECGGGTYIRSLVRDVGRELDSCATMTSLVRTKQGPFELDRAMKKEEWTAESVYQAVEETNQWLEEVFKED